MRRIIIALALAAVTAPVLSGCIIIANDKPTSTRVIHSTPERN